MALHSYLNLIRFYQPAGTLLLMWPPLWVLVLLHEGLPPLPLLLAFILGAFLMRSAGCIINDITDQKLDQHVARTRSRPLASGLLSRKQALGFLSVLLAVAAGIAWFLGRDVFLASLLALPLIIAYPWMKRITYWPQLFLGITFNYGCILASVATLGTVHPAALLIYLGSILWTLGYDTIYGFQDIADDETIGIKSTARLFSKHAKPVLGVVYFSTIICWGFACYALSVKQAFYVGLLAVAAHFCWQIWRLDISQPQACRHLFLSNATLGGGMFFGLLLL